MQQRRSTPVSRGPQNYKYPPNRRPQKRRDRGRRRLVSLCVLALLIAVLWFFLDTVIALGVGTPRFYNVYVNGVALRGYTREQGYAMFDTLQADWQNAAYELYYGDKTWTFSPAAIGAELNYEETIERAWNFGHVGNIFTRKSQVKSLRNSPCYFVSSVTYDEDLMDDFLRSIQTVTDCEPVNAVIALDVDKPRVLKESSNGAELQVDKALELFNTLLLYGSEEKRVELPVEVLKPAVSTEDVSSALGDGEPIVEYSTSIQGSSSNRKNNVKVALKKFNGIQVNPGDTISFNEVVGARTAANGFKTAPEYSEGETKTGTGGGTCQASTTLYGAVLRAGMTIVRRSSHSMVVGYVPPSLDAAVTETGSKDLVFRNDTENPIFIYTTVTEARAYVYIYGNRPAYNYQFEWKILEDNIAPTEEITRADTEGAYVTYTDETKLVEGKAGRRSELYMVSCDWATGEEVARTKVSTDYYSPGKNILYVGVVERGGATSSATDTPW